MSAHCKCEFRGQLWVCVSVCVEIIKLCGCGVIHWGSREGKSSLHVEDIGASDVQKNANFNNSKQKKRSARRVLFYHESTVWNTAVVSLIQSLSASTETLLLKRVVQGPGSLYGSELCINSNVRKCRITASICTFGIKLPQLKLLLTARGDLLGNVDLTAVVGMSTALKWLFFKFQRHFFKAAKPREKTPWCRHLVFFGVSGERMELKDMSRQYFIHHTPWTLKMWSVS